MDTASSKNISCNYLLLRRQKPATDWPGVVKWMTSESEVDEDPSSLTTSDFECGQRIPSSPLQDPSFECGQRIPSSPLQDPSFECGHSPTARKHNVNSVIIGQRSSNKWKDTDYRLPITQTFKPKNATAAPVSALSPFNVAVHNAGMDQLRMTNQTLSEEKD